MWVHVCVSVFLVCAAREAKEGKEAKEAAMQAQQAREQSAALVSLEGSFEANPTRAMQSLRADPKLLQALLAQASHAERQQLVGMLGGGADAASLAVRGAGAARGGRGGRR